MSMYHRRKLVFDLMTAASAPRISVRRDTETDTDDEGHPIMYDRISLQIGPGREVGPFLDEDELEQFVGRVAKLKRRHAVLS